jgi:hypothetical protein
VKYQQNLQVIIHGFIVSEKYVSVGRISTGSYTVMFNKSCDITYCSFVRKILQVTDFHCPFYQSSRPEKVGIFMQRSVTCVHAKIVLQSPNIVCSLFDSEHCLSGETLCN